MIKIIGLIALFLVLNAQAALDKPSELELKKMIAKMLVVGFDGEQINEKNNIYRYIKKYELGGVILFDREYHDRNRTKNIKSPAQLQVLTAQLQAISPKPLLISVDQEGGRVARMKPLYGFTAIPSAATIAKEYNETQAKKVYVTLAKELHVNGVNCNFAPVIDLAVNPKNGVIYQLERSYGNSSEIVTRYAKVFMEALREEGVVSVLKHFPGHGSSLDDSHEGFVDVTKTWSQEELQPYKKLIDAGGVDMIMTAHVYNENLDRKYPATLSYEVNSNLLRNKMNYNGVIISDDLQMKAISKQYDLKETVTLAINSGVDMLLFGNQLAQQDTGELIDVICEQVNAGAISIKRIRESNKRVDALLQKYFTPIEIVDRPIDFGAKRIAMTKEYIKDHYDLNVTDITIEPKIILLHWTAVMDLNDSFERLKGEKLFTDRKDIAKASLLNVSAHFIVDRDGTIYRLMPENWMARHAIGLNYSSIGVENIGGENNEKEDLTPAQVKANIALVGYLKAKYPTIEYLIGHHEYRDMEATPLWLEKDDDYRTVKKDPGKKFMSEVREGVKMLELKLAPVKVK